MLYTEDTYTLPEEDYFGYLRGRYSEEEMKEFDSYASMLGIEMMGCIQTLGHLSSLLQWPFYSNINDTSSVLLVNEEKTYQLIEKMLQFFSTSFSSRRIHIGMDEAHDLGRGKYMDLNGYKCSFDIFCEHLQRVKSLCEKYGLEPMIWSDMFFRMGSKTGMYYDKDSKIPAKVKDNIPKDVQLVYWDYYHTDKEFYKEWIKRHRELGFNPIMASGIWTWSSLWYDKKKTENTVLPCVDSCIEDGIDEIFFTLWGDDGAYCSFDSAFAGLCFAAEKVYKGERPEKELLEKRFKALFNGSYLAQVKASVLSDINLKIPVQTDNVDINAAMLLWDDPLLGIYWKTWKFEDSSIWKKVLQKYSEAKIELQSHASDTMGNIKHALILLELLEEKITLKLLIDEAYLKKDITGMEKTRALIPNIIELLDQLLLSFRSEWHLKHKPFGLEVIQIRLAGQKERFKELDLRLGEYVEGRICSIPELEEESKFVMDERRRYKVVATGSSIL
ncbi:MAG: family 20 glycosylhydrolase [Candidatus Ratteibacteria bacterium]